MLFGASTILGGVGRQRDPAAEQDGGSGAQVLIGRDDDNVNNPIIQPANTPESELNNTDVQRGGSGNDRHHRVLGSDVKLGGSATTSGRRSGSGAPNSDIMFGDSGDD